jgi:hypothetical protein
MMMASIILIAEDNTYLTKEGNIFQTAEGFMYTNLVRMALQRLHMCT